MDDKVKELLDKIRGTASVAADAAADTARVAGKKAGQMVDVAKLEEVKSRIADLRQSRSCPACGAPCGKGDKFCRSCGASL